MRYRIGIDLGGTNIKAGLVDEKDRILLEKRIPTDAERTADEIIGDMAKLVRDLLCESAAAGGDIAGVGIGSPGTIDTDTGMVVYSNNMNWENVPLGPILSDMLSLSVKVANDANCAALGEMKAGGARGCSSFVLITLGTGVGFGIVIGGKVFDGAKAGGAELGHTSLISGGELCSCGRRGCLEAYASATALIRDTRRAAERSRASAIWKFCGGDLSNVGGKTAFDAAEAGDPTAQRVLEEYIRYLGEGIVNVVNIFRPELVLISGGVCVQGARLTGPLQAYADRYCFAGKRGFIPKIAIAELENSAGILGAAALFDE